MIVIVISNYAFSELSSHCVAVKYAGSLIANSRHGYMTYNHIADNNLTKLSDILTCLPSTVHVLDDEPIMSEGGKALI